MGKGENGVSDQSGLSHLVRGHVLFETNLETET